MKGISGSLNFDVSTIILGAWFSLYLLTFHVIGLFIDGSIKKYIITVDNNSSSI